MNYKNYLYSLRYLILIAFLIFSFSIIYGYLAAQSSPQEMEIIIEEFEKIFQPILEASPFVQFLLVFLNNALTVILTILLAVVFGIFPLLVLFSNGLLIGIFAFLWGQELPWIIFFKAILPHGLIEIPLLIVASAIGLKIGQAAFRKVFQKQGQIKPELSLALKFFLKILLPLLALAAFIEIFLTPLLLK
jgi:stage II sporulation protein M